MGIVNIDDDLHEQLRRASKVSCRSINAQAAYWIKDRHAVRDQSRAQLRRDHRARAERRRRGGAAAGDDRSMTKQPRNWRCWPNPAGCWPSVFGLLDRTPLAGRSTLEINDLVERFIVDMLHARPASKGQYGYGFVLNSSVNEVVCHGVPSPSDVLSRRRHRQFRHHAREERLHRRLQQDLSGRRR
jgi:hypothetical protein